MNVVGGLAFMFGHESWSAYHVHGLVLAVDLLFPLILDRLCLHLEVGESSNNILVAYDPLDGRVTRPPCNRVKVLCDPFGNLWRSILLYFIEK